MPKQKANILHFICWQLIIHTGSTWQSLVWLGSEQAGTSDTSGRQFINSSETAVVKNGQTKHCNNCVLLI